MTDAKAGPAALFDLTGKVALVTGGSRGLGREIVLAFARAEGSAAFAINCSPCHGAGGQGSRGYPNLNADRWIWGGAMVMAFGGVVSLSDRRWRVGAATRSTRGHDLVGRERSPAGRVTARVWVRRRGSTVNLCQSPNAAMPSIRT